MLHITLQTSSRSKYTNRFLELLLRAMGVQILRYYSEVFEPGVQILQSSWTGGPVISEGVQILRSSWIGGTISGGSIFFVTVHHSYLKLHVAVYTCKLGLAICSNIF